MLFLQVYKSEEYFYCHLIGKETKDHEDEGFLQDSPG